MESSVDFIVYQTGKLGVYFDRLGLESFMEVADWVQALPYRRPSRPLDPNSVLEDGCGTCSSKHALLAALAEEQGQSQVRLEVGLFMITSRNMRAARKVLADYPFDGFPEAHCYLMLGEERHDYTFSGGTPAFAIGEPIDSMQLRSDQLELKEEWHRARMEAWCQQEGVDVTEVWKAREEVIARLSF